jgi:hypothetical protein
MAKAYIDQFQKDVDAKEMKEKRHIKFEVFKRGQSFPFGR